MINLRTPKKEAKAAINLRTPNFFSATQVHRTWEPKVTSLIAASRFAMLPKPTRELSRLRRA